MFIINFFLGALIMFAGVMALRYNVPLTRMFPKSYFLERRLGSGSTYLLFQLTSVVAVLFGFLVMFSLHDNVVEFLLSPIINLLRLD